MTAYVAVYVTVYVTTVYVTVYVTVYYLREGATCDGSAVQHANGPRLYHST